MSASLKSQASSEATFFGHLSRQRTSAKPLPADVRLTDQIAVITGANAGLGLEASRHLLRLGLAHLVMGVRSQARGDAAAAKLRAEFPAAAVSVWLLDMASYDSVREFAGRCAALPRLDVAILNAGCIATRFELAPQSGHEVSMQVNYISTALLAVLLLPLLHKSKVRNNADKSPVLSIVGSDVMWSTPLSTAGGPLLQRFDMAKTFSAFKSYAVAKVLAAFFVWKLADEVDPDKVVVNLVNPGMTGGTSFFTRQPYVARMAIVFLQYLMARKPDVAATVYVDAVVARGPESHGSILSDWAVKPYPSLFYTTEGKELRDILWEETMEELRFAEASKIVADLKKQ